MHQTINDIEIPDNNIGTIEWRHAISSNMNFAAAESAGG